MTVAIGVLCDRGLVLGADREVTYDAIKTSEKKAYLLKHGNCRVALVGAGSHRLITNAAQSLRDRLSQQALWDADAVRGAILEIYTNIKEAYLDANPGHTLDLLVGMKIAEPKPREMRLLALEGGIPTWVEDDTKFAAVGWGHHIARYLLKRLYGTKGKPSVARGVSMVAHAVKEVKDNVSDVGKESDIIFMQWGYQADYISELDILEHERVASRFMQAVQPVMLALADINIQNDQLNDIIGRLSTELYAMRSNEFLRRQAEKFKARTSTGPMLRVTIHETEGSSNAGPSRAPDSPTIFYDAETSAAPFSFRPEGDDDE